MYFHFSSKKSCYSICSSLQTYSVLSDNTGCSTFRSGDNEYSYTIEEMPSQEIIQRLAVFPFVFYVNGLVRKDKLQENPLEIRDFMGESMVSGRFSLQIKSID